MVEPSNNGHKRLLSPLRYPGSKRRLIGYIKKALEINNFKPSLYVEPFVGGGSVAIQLLHEDLVDKVIINDKDPWIASFWKTVFFDTEWLVKQVKTIDVSLDEWKKFKSSEPETIRDQALACFFLNRTSFSGILRDEVGPLGGRLQASEYKIDCRFTRPTLVDRIEAIAHYRDRILDVLNCSWAEIFEPIQNAQLTHHIPSEETFFYLDPPFFDEAESLYRFYFLQNDHEHLRDYLLSLEDKWILSYDSEEQVEALYGSAIKKGTNGTSKHSVELIYSLAIISEKKRKRGTEVIISNLEKLP
jgi:DNA adenine methylase